MEICSKYVWLSLLGIVVSLPCFVNIALGDSWKNRACVGEYKQSCDQISKNYTEPYCITSEENSRNSTFDCLKLSLVNEFSTNSANTRMTDFTMRDVISNYCSLLYNDAGNWRIYFAKPNDQTSNWDWSQTFDSHQSLFLYAFCSSFKDKDWKMVFLEGKEIPIEKVFTWNLTKLLKLQQLSENWKDFCLPVSDTKAGDYTLNDCDMAIYATKIYEAIMSDLYKIKYAQVLDVDTIENFDIKEKVKDFMTGYNLSDKTYKELNDLYPKTLSILESNQMFYEKILRKVKIIDNSMLAKVAKKEKKCIITWDIMTWVDFVACALHSSQWKKFALTPSFVSLLYNEILHYRLFIMYHQLWVNEMEKKPGLWRKDIDLLDSKISDFEWYSQKQLEATKKVQHDFEDFNMTYPLHIWLLMYAEKVEKFRNNSLSKIITSFYSLSEKLQNVQEPL